MLAAMETQPLRRPLGQEPGENGQGRGESMLTVEPTGAILGATIQGVDLSKPLTDAAFGRILLALGEHGVLRFPGQQLDIGDVKRFSELFGEIQGSPISALDASRPYPEVGILSNIKE